MLCLWKEMLSASQSGNEKLISQISLCIMGIGSYNIAKQKKEKRILLLGVSFSFFEWLSCGWPLRILITIIFLRQDGSMWLLRTPCSMEWVKRYVFHDQSTITRKRIINSVSFILQIDDRNLLRYVVKRL